MKIQPPEDNALLLFVTDNAFQIQERGCVLTPGVPDGFTPFPRRDASLLLRRPDGRCINGIFLATEMFGLSRSTKVPILVGPVSLQKSEVPVGTEVWLLSAQPSA